jgi:hypothetical protein
VGFVRRDSDFSDGDVIGAFRRQLRSLARTSEERALLLLAWKDQPGVTMDELTAAVTEAETGIPAPVKPAGPAPGSTRPSPFT